MADDATSATADDDNLFERAKNGDQVAWSLLFESCYPKVQRVVRRRIDGPLRRFVDSTDIASDVFGDLARKAALLEFETLEDVRKFLISAAMQRIADEHRHHQARRRDARRERPIGDAAGGDAWGISSGEPTPSQHAVARETDQLLDEATPDLDGRRVLELRREQYSNEEIAGLIGWSRRKVERFLQKLRPAFVH